MKIAIHHYDGDPFSEGWISYCKDNNIPFKIVNAYDNDIVNQVQDCTAFMWHHSHGNYKDLLFAKQLLYSLQTRGVMVFPNYNTTWHFDDKIGQKYLLEAINAPFVPTYVFYSKDKALEWANNTSFPKVFKLRGGAGSTNVKLLRSKKEAISVIKQAFGKGFPQFNRWGNLKERYNRYKYGRGTLTGVLKGVARLFITPKDACMRPPEKGYVYFQDFIPNNLFDIRIVVIGDNAFAIKRLCREDDFRASGSGRILYGKDEFDERCVRISFEINETINAQSLAVDFVFNLGAPMIVEISYGFDEIGYKPCVGYWDKSMIWHEASLDLHRWMVQQII